jgi:hypothetical protein
MGGSDAPLCYPAPQCLEDGQRPEAAAAKSTRIGNDEMSDRVRWIRSYVVNEPDGTLGRICIYEARDPASIRDHAKRVGMPADDIDLIGNTVVVRLDPEQK